ncbi:MAG: NERD domain-containing protein [Nostoc sp. DedQUE08]|uniref:NERD domain-containing protein n=1 Tax=Nostoc sp. DedQUE08 TaxID=3075393 RepID=UPI002AD37342|nr:NERD domain-containing protein [Nostoc sp. DedQUE08]MDZ8069008.1 NERD domain-containing protein [Nostoc sp. DedQUE08]
MTKKLQNLESVKVIPSSKANRVAKVAKRLGRLSLTGIVTFGIGAFTIFDRYNNYWDKTIFRVQTVDFNILSHTLPTKLSYALIQNKSEELQRTLDSNYSLFGLIVTDPSGEKVIASSGNGSSRSSWKAALNPQELKNHPYDLLLDPPPLYSQWSYEDSRAVERTATSLTNQGRVIGRVYYVRGVRPTFEDDFFKWLSNPIATSSRIETYTMTMLACLTGGLAFWILWEYLLYKKQVQKEEAEHIENTLRQQKDSLLLQLRERINQIKVLQKQWEQERINSIKQAEELHSYNQQLQQEISQLKNTVISVPAVTNLQSTKGELDKARTEAESARQKQQEQESQIQLLNHQLQVYQSQLTGAIHQGKSLKLLQSQIEEVESARSIAELELGRLRNSEHQFIDTITSLEKQLASQQDIQAQLNRQLEILQRTLIERERQKQESHQKAERAIQQMARLTEEIEIIKEDMGRHPLNDFEQAVLNCLQSNLPQKEILTQFDVGNGGDNSKFTDFIVILTNCIIVLEVKSYKGVIEPTGDLRNTNWICRRGSDTIIVNACWGQNPYQQVKIYTDSLLRRTRNSSRIRNLKLPVYGLVVFPSEASIASSIESNIGGFYRVTTLNNLPQTIQDINLKAHSQNARRMTPQQIAQSLIA